ncbi:MAG TPA: MBL fold metallo-hydrolase [Solirubrobacteraceae bacterium]|jgi:glyoxylase-like metal-dependent hydrolase (beta-lactamase superfamily II)
MEVAPGIHRIEGDLGERYVCQYLLRGEERTLLVDTGLRDMPAEVIAPYVDLTDIDEVLISHADVDHCGGNRALRSAAPAARFLCGEADRPWIESNAAMLADNYRWYEAYGFGPSADDVAFLERELGGDAPIDVGLRGGETLRLGPSWRVEVLALPGHTPGHLGLWDPRSGAAIIIDAVLSDGVYDRAGNRLIPPRYYSARDYEATIRRLRALDPALLLTAHYDVMERDSARAFLDRSLAFVQSVRDAVRAGTTTDLWPLTQEVDAAVGPFPAFTHELAASVRAHLAEA